MHMTFKKYFFKNYTKLKEPRNVKMGDHNIQEGIGVGDIHMKLKNNKIGIMSNVLHVPGL